MGGGQTRCRFLGEQLLAGLGDGQQAAQAVVQAQFLRRALCQGVAFGGDELAVLLDKGGFAAVGGQAAILQGIEQRLAGWVGLCGPALEELGLPGRVGGDEVTGYRVGRKTLTPGPSPGGRGEACGFMSGLGCLALRHPSPHGRGAGGEGASEFNFFRQIVKLR